MNEKAESIFIYILYLIFVTGSALFLFRFYTFQEPNFYAFGIFLIAILVLILFYDKIEEFLLSRDGIRLIIKKVTQENQKIITDEQRKKAFEKAYETKQEIKEGV